MFRIIGEIGQWAAFGICIGGLYVEVTYEADLGFILLTAGGILWGMFTKIKYYSGRGRSRRKGDNRNNGIQCFTDRYRNNEEK